MFDVFADDFLSGGGVGGFIGLESINEPSKLDFGIFNDFLEFISNVLIDKIS